MNTQRSHRFCPGFVSRLWFVVCFAVMANPCSAAPAEMKPMNFAKANIQKWVDADGQVHYGDSPPADTNAAPLHVRPNVIEVDLAAPPTSSLEAAGKPGASMHSMPTTAPAASLEIDRYVAWCRENRGVDCELEARQMIDGPAPVLFPGDPAVFPRPDVKPPPPGLRLKYSITP